MRYHNGIYRMCEDSDIIRAKVWLNFVMPLLIQKFLEVAILLV